MRDERNTKNESNKWEKLQQITNLLVLYATTAIDYSKNNT
jgi:hypothetical protein